MESFAKQKQWDLFKDVQEVFSEPTDTATRKIESLIDLLKYTSRASTNIHGNTVHEAQYTSDGHYNYRTEDLKVSLNYFEETIKDFDKTMHILNGTVTNNDEVYVHLSTLRGHYVELAIGTRNELERREKLIKAEAIINKF